MSNALVTGGAGFIGSHLVRGLLARGDRVRVLDNLSSGDRRNLDGLDVEFVEGDIRDRATVSRALQGVETVFHLAAMISVPESMADPRTCYDVNVIGSLNVLWGAHQAGVRRVVLSSSCAIYGDVAGPADEQAPVRPLSPYAASKLAMEEAGRLFTNAYGLPTVSLRYFNVYGPRQSPASPYAAVIPLFIQAMLSGQAPTINGDGRQTRDFVFVDDVVRANLLAAEREGAAGGVFNVSGGRSVSILELTSSLQEIIPNAPAPGFGPPRSGDVRFSAAVLSQAERALGYRPVVGLKDGLKGTVEWFRAAGSPNTR